MKARSRRYRCRHAKRVASVTPTHISAWCLKSQRRAAKPDGVADRLTTAAPRAPSEEL